jgi:hypothetical protein
MEFLDDADEMTPEQRLAEIAATNPSRSRDCSAF